MHVVHTELDVRQEAQEEFERIEKDYKETIRGWPGFRSYQVLRSAIYVSSTSPELEAPRPYLRYLHMVGWESREHQLAWTGSPQFETWRDEITPLLTDSYRAVFYETALE